MMMTSFMSYRIHVYIFSIFLFLSLVLGKIKSKTTYTLNWLHTALVSFVKLTTWCYLQTISLLYSQQTHIHIYMDWVNQRMCVLYDSWICGQSLTPLQYHLIELYVLALSSVRVKISQLKRLFQIIILQYVEKKFFKSSLSSVDRMSKFFIHHTASTSTFKCIYIWFGAKILFAKIAFQFRLSGFFFLSQHHHFKDAIY